MKPHIHSQNSVTKWGGKATDYSDIHNFMDSTKAILPDMRHRAIYHSAFGIFIVELIFGDTITNSDGKLVSVRDIAEQHVMEDLGFIPTLQDWLNEMNISDWMLSPQYRKNKNARPGDQNPVYYDIAGGQKEPAIPDFFKDDKKQNPIPPQQPFIYDPHITTPSPPPIQPTITDMVMPMDDMNNVLDGNALPQNTVYRPSYID